LTAQFIVIRGTLGSNHDAAQWHWIAMHERPKQRSSLRTHHSQQAFADGARGLLDPTPNVICVAANNDDQGKITNAAYMS
jgi:hypothetical protein